MSEFLALDLPDLRRRLEDHKATRPADVFSPEMQPWMKTKDSLAFAIELKEAEARQKPFYITVPPQPIERPVQPLLRLRKSKPKPAPKPTPKVEVRPTPSTPENPMPARKKHPTPEAKAEARRAYQRQWLAKKKAAKQGAPPPALGGSSCGGCHAA